MVEEHESLKEVLQEKKRRSKAWEERIEDKRIEDELEWIKEWYQKMVERSARGFRGFTTFSLYLYFVPCYRSR